MDRRMIVEVLDARGRVVQRIPVAQDTLTVGRSLENDVILDDPHLDVRHARFDRDAATGLWSVTDLDSLNGTAMAGSRLPAGATLGYETGTPIRLGESTIRLVPVAAAAVDTVPLNRRLLGAFEPRIAMLLGLSAIATAAGATGLWLAWYEPDPIIAPVVGAIGVVFGIAMWGGVWALGNRIFGGRSNFRAHATIAAAAITVYIAVGSTSGFVSFAAPGSIVLTALGSVFGTILVALPLLAHIDVASSRPIRFKVTLVIAIVVGLTAMAIPLSWIPLGSVMEVRASLGPIRPLPEPLILTSTPDEFAAELESLEEELIEAASDEAGDETGGPD